MQNLVQFSFQNHPVRVVMIDGEPWWVAKDVCDVLEYAWSGAASIRHVPGEWKGIDSVPTPFGDQQMNVLSEQGLYFFVARSDKPKALPFQKWLAGDVVPSIRKTGSYSVAPVYQIPQTYAEALRLAADLSEKVEAQKQTIAIMEPKAEFHDAVAVAENCQEVGEVARVLNTGRNRLFKWMREQKILIPDTRLPYQEFVDAGYFRVIEQTWESNGGDTNITTKTLVTGKGLLWLQKRYKQGA